MCRLLTCIIAALISFSAVAEHHSPAKVEVPEAVRAFNGGYESNNVDACFSHYSDEATLYFSGTRQIESAYLKQWTETVSVGGAVERYALSAIMAGLCRVVTLPLQHASSTFEGDRQTGRVPAYRRGGLRPGAPARISPGMNR